MNHLNIVTKQCQKSIYTILGVLGRLVSKDQIIIIKYDLTRYLLKQIQDFLTANFPKDTV